MNRPSPSQFRPIDTPDALAPGSRLSEYEILSVLGQGNSGIVYLCMDHGLQRHVAIKEYLPTALASRAGVAAVLPRSDAQAESFAHGLAAFIDEARLLARLDHPALVRVYRFWEANGTAYMVMPHYEGVTLDVARQAMTRPPDEAWLRDLLLPLLGALDALHSASCYPRDISPENILLLPDGQPVLLDFGATRNSGDDRARALTVTLKPAFVPIEQYAESASLPQGPWTSLYSLAAVAYYCIGGQPPVASTVRALDDQMEPLFQMVDRLGRSFPHLDYSVGFVSAIERALSVRPQERPQSVAEFRRALIGGRGAAEPVGVPPGSDEATVPPRSVREDPSTLAPPQRPAPYERLDGPADAALRDALNAVLRPDPFREDVAPPRNAAGLAHGAGAESAPREPPQRSQPRGAPGPNAGPNARTRSDPPTGHPDRDRDEADEVARPDALAAAALHLDPEDFGRSPLPERDAQTRRRRRRWLLASATAALLALGAAGWLMWWSHQDGSMTLPSMALRMEPEGRPAPSLPPELAIQPPAFPPTAPAAEPPLSVPQPDATTSAPPQSSESTAPSPLTDFPAEASAEADLSEADLSSEEPPPPPEAVEVAPPPPAKAVSADPNNPRELCGTRTQFSLYRCMKAACDRSKYFDHPECKYLRVTDEVRPLR